MTRNTNSLKSNLLTGLSALALAAAFVALSPIAFSDITGGAAYAADDGHDDGGSDGHDGGHEGGQGSGKGQGGENSGAHGSDGHADSGSAGQGQGGPDADSEGRGPQHGAGDGTSGTRPVWAKEGIPEVELGRLNVARSPDHVLSQAMAEAIANFTPEMAAFYSLSLPEMIDLLTNDFDNVTMIDSPLENLGLLKDALDGTSVLTTDLGVVNSTSVLAAVLLGSASDKTVTVSPETAYAVGIILGFEMTEAEAAALAADAESIREAILEGHG